MRLTAVKVAIWDFSPKSKTTHPRVTQLLSKDAEDTISYNRYRGLEGVSAVENVISK